MFQAFKYVINARSLLGHHVTTHLFMPSSMCAQTEYCLSLMSWVCMCFMLLVMMVMMAMSST